MVRCLRTLTGALARVIAHIRYTSGSSIASGGLAALSPSPAHERAVDDGGAAAKEARVGKFRALIDSPKVDLGGLMHNVLLTL